MGLSLQLEDVCHQEMFSWILGPHTKKNPSSLALFICSCQFLPVFPPRRNGLWDLLTALALKEIGSLQTLGAFCPSGPVSHQGCGSLHAKILQRDEQPLQGCSCRTLIFMQLWTLPLLLSITSWLPAQWLAHSRCPINIQQLNDILFSSDTPGNYWNQLVTASQGHCVGYCSYKKYEPSFLRTQVCQRNLQYFSLVSPEGTSFGFHQCKCQLFR